MPTPLPKTHALQQHPVLQCLAKAVAHNQQRLVNTTLWLACSGGRDSLALTYAAYLLKLPVKVLHVNHQLQPQSNAWATHVKHTVQGWQLPIEVLTVTPTAANEAAARQARYDALFYCMQTNDVLLLAHHANDQAETLLMNLFKGTGLTGLTAMQAWSSQQHNGNSYQLWRPWLTLNRQQISDFANLAELPYIDDPTNSTSTNDRGYLRQQVMPVITARWHKAVNNICRSSQNVAEAKQSVDAISQADLKDCHTNFHNYGHTPNSKALDINKLLALEKARQTHLISYWLKGQHSLAPSRHCVEQVLQLAHSTNTNQQAIIVVNHTQIRRYRHHLYQVIPPLATAETVKLTATLGKTLQLACGRWQIVATAQTDQHPTQNKTQHKYRAKQAGFAIDKQLLEHPLTLRPRQQGERLNLVSRQGSTSFKQICQELHIAPWLREQVLLLYYQQTPIALLTHVGCFLCRSPYLVHSTHPHTGWIMEHIGTSSSSMA